MILVDTSVWVDHFRRRNDALVSLLLDTQVLSHAFVIGELACGNLKKRAQILEYLAALPQAPAAEHHEVLSLIDRRRLAGTGIGWIDAHLLASVLLADTALWTHDKPLAAAAHTLGVSAAL